MSRFVRASKYRHVYGQTGKKEYAIENVKVSGQAWDTNLISASANYLALNWVASGGGAFAILPLPSPWGPNPHGLPTKIPDIIPLARGHTAPVLDTAWSPFNDSVVASGGDDGNVLIWKVEESQFEGWGSDHWQPIDFEPAQKVSASARKIGQILFHPTASHVLATASGDHHIKLWDLASSDSPKLTLSSHTDTIQSFDFNPTGNLLVSTCRDRKLRVFDARAGGDPVLVADGHSGVKGARVVWLGERDEFATTGFSKMSDRQVGLWGLTSGLKNLKMIGIDQSAGVLMPFWSDNGILFLAGKGDGNVRYYEYESSNLIPLDEYKSTEPQRGMCFLPRRALNVAECEIARAYKVISTASQSAVEPIGFVVPRRSDAFQADIFPPAPSSEPSLSAGEFFSGRGDIALNVVDLGTGGVSPSGYTPSPSSFSMTLPPKTPEVTSAKSLALAPPSSASTTTTTTSTNASLKTTTSTSAIGTGGGSSGSKPSVASGTLFKPPTNLQEHPGRDVDGKGDGSSSANVQKLVDENTTLTGELRKAHALIRSLELQVEALKANQRKAMEALEGGR